jgi:MOSC domain-containing protein YiiM
MSAVKAIAYRTQPKAAMSEIDAVEITCAHGVVPDTRGKPGRRQVTVLSLEAWQSVCTELGAELPWTFRRANLLIEGIHLGPSDVGKVLCIGQLELEITQETDPCQRMDDQHPGLMAALTPHWRAGVCCRVLKSGTVHVGDAALLRA